MFLKVVACEVAFREICHCAAASPNLFDLEFVSQGYHDNPDVGLRALQGLIDAVGSDRYDGILLGYGLCNNMLAGLQARDLPVVIPRAHDCITFFLGSRQRYDHVFKEQPGTYYYTAGWLEYRQRGGVRVERRQNAALGQERSFQELVSQYGEENARFLADFMDSWTQHYSRGLYINFPFTSHLPARHDVQRLCQERNWQYEELDGDLSLLQSWLDGRWDAHDFLVVEPGQTVQPSYGPGVLQIAMPGDAGTA